MSNTFFLLEQKSHLDVNNELTMLLRHYTTFAESRKVKGRYTSLNIHGTNILFATIDQNSEKLDFVEFGFSENYFINMRELRKQWGSYKISDQTERDNFVALIFHKIAFNYLKSIEIIAKNRIGENHMEDEVLIFGAKFIYK
jgi:hypothetical protein